MALLISTTAKGHIEKYVIEEIEIMRNLTKTDQGTDYRVTTIRCKLSNGKKVSVVVYGDNDQIFLDFFHPMNDFPQLHAAYEHSDGKFYPTPE